jgi:hypothetical protein
MTGFKMRHPELRQNDRRGHFTATGYNAAVGRTLSRVEAAAGTSRKKQ